MDPEFAAFVGGAQSEVEQRIREDAPAPDLAAMVARAHQIDPQRVSQAAVSEAASYATVIPLQLAKRLRDTRNDPKFDEIVQEVRGHVEHKIARALVEPNTTTQPTPIVPLALPQPSLRRYWALGTAMAVAAALLVGVGIGSLRTILASQASDDQGQHAAMSVESGDTTRQARHRPKAVPVAPPQHEAPQPPQEDEVVIIVDDPEPAAVVEPAARSRRASRGERLARLDAEAHVAWKAGELKQATALFERLAKLDRRGSLGELAYGDLFTLAKQRGMTHGQTRLWRNYLKHYPRGRFSDDARAGLCRRSSSTRRAACWSAYLKDMPSGAYRAQARREGGS